MSDHQNAGAVLDRPHADEQRRVPLSSIELREGHNPREQVVRDKDFGSLVATVRQHGVLQPLRVTEPEPGRYELVAGERRYWAAIEAACIDVPVIVRAAGAGANSDLLVEALIENEMRVDLNPIERAKAYAKLAESLTVKGIAEQLGRTQKHVRETLALLGLAERIQALIVDGELPRYAVPSLLALGRVHEQFPEIAVDVVADPELDFEWSDVRDDPLAVVYASSALPAGVYRFNIGYPAESFELTDKAQRDLKAILRLTRMEQAIVTFRHEDEQAGAALKAVYASERAEWAKLLIGSDVAAQLACDQLARRATMLRRRERADRERERHAARAREAAAAPDDADEPDAQREAEAAAERGAAELERQEQLRREQEEAAREQAAAVAYNDELGAAVINNLSVLKVDARIMKILAAVPIAHAMPAIATRGAAYGFPGWPIVTQRADGETTRSYLGRDAAVAKADEYLAGAKKPGEIAGRMFALLVMAIFADDRCLPIHLRTNYMPLVQGGPWRTEVGELIDSLVAEHLPLRLVQAKLDERKAAREAAAEQIAAQETVRAALARLDELTAEEVQEVEDALPAAWTEAWHPERRKAAAAMNQRRTTLAEEQAGEPEETEARDAQQEDEAPVAAAA